MTGLTHALFINGEFEGEYDPAALADTNDLDLRPLPAGYWTVPLRWNAAEGDYLPVSPRSAAAPLTPLAFQRLFSQAERIAIRTSADPIVQDFMALSAIALDIDLADQDVMAGVGYLEMIGLIGAGRAAVVLSGQAPS